MPYKSYPELLEETRARIHEVSAREAKALHARGDVVFLDVREPQEANLGMVPGAVFIPRGQLESHVEEKIPREATIVVYCARGNRSAFAADSLAQMGYDHVQSMAGGFADWVGEGGDVE